MPWHTLLAFTAEHFSRLPRNRIHLRPESTFWPGIFIHIESESLFTSLRNDYSHRRAGNRPQDL
jgi:hypothetical protein